MTSGEPKGIALSYLSLGAGVQSSTIVEMMVLGLLPKVDLVVFSDLEDEPSYVYRQLAYLEGRLKEINVPLVRLHPGGVVGKLLSDEVYLSIPAYAPRDGHRARLRRDCTQQLKIRVIQGHIKSLLAERGLTRPRRMKTTTAQVVKQGVLVECWLGLTIDEAHRLKPNQKPWIVNCWPLTAMGLTRGQRAIWLANHGLPVPQKSWCVSQSCLPSASAWGWTRSGSRLGLRSSDKGWAGTWSLPAYPAPRDSWSK